MLNSKGLRQRFIATCLKGASTVDKLRLKSFGKKHLDWRWESLGKLLDDLGPLLPLLRRHWDLSNMRDGEGAMSSIAAGCIVRVDVFLKHRHLEPSVELLRIVAIVVNRWASYLEGCACHEHIWTSKCSRDRQMKMLMEELGASRCPWKGVQGL